MPFMTASVSATLGSSTRTGLEAALEGLVLLDILAVLVEGGGADDLYLTAGEGRLEDVARVHGALTLTGGGDGVDLVNEQDDVAGA